MSWAEVAQDSIHRTGGAITGKGATTRSMEAPAFGANVVDLEVDPGTGKIKILKFTCFQDVGCAINPQQVEGQIQGGAVQGIGWAITEYYHYDKGVLRNPSLLDYRILTALDLPMLDTVITEKPASVGPYGARGRWRDLHRTASTGYSQRHPQGRWRAYARSAHDSRGGILGPSRKKRGMGRKD